jgi:diaminopropionate ammonia-lyase
MKVDVESPEALLALCPAHAATPLLYLPNLAAALGVSGVLAKDEGRRSLGSFKALGGVYAGLRALARAAEVPTRVLLDPTRMRTPLPALVCASAGNHGLSVASAARLAGAKARVFISEAIPEARASRVAAKGADVVRVAGSFDDAVRQAAEAARAAGDLLIPDTSRDPEDPVVRDVMAGYGIIAKEVRAEIAVGRRQAPTHVFVQAGVGGLAAAVTAGLSVALAPPARVVIVEPERAACVAAALSAGHAVSLKGTFDSSAEMLACGEASAPALAILCRHRVEAMSVSEADLSKATALLRAHGLPNVSPSGAAGLAGLAAVMNSPQRAGRFDLSPESRPLLIISESSPS